MTEASNYKHIYSVRNITFDNQHENDEYFKGGTFLSTFKMLVILVYVTDTWRSVTYINIIIIFSRQGFPVSLAVWNSLL